MNGAVTGELPLANPGGAPPFIVSLASFEGPLDLLLALARAQKIDLQKVPMLPLVDQYLAYVGEVQAQRLEVAADYLVMAAWLAYLKSALLLPKEEAPDPDPHELGQRLRHRLLRLAAMRDAAERLAARDLLGRDLFTRGAPEGLRTVRKSRIDVSLYQLLAAYGALSARPPAAPWTPHDRGAILGLEEALQRLSTLIGATPDWTELRQFLPKTKDAAFGRSALASSFVAALELARTGAAELRQQGAFGPLLLRPRG